MPAFQVHPGYFHLYLVPQLKDTAMAPAHQPLPGFFIAIVIIGQVYQAY